MDQSLALRARLDGLETHELLAQWRASERAPWAEAVFRDVLVARGVAEVEAQRAIAANDPPAESLPRFALVGRFVAVFLALALSQIFNAIVPNLGAALAMVVFGIYAAMLVRMLIRVARRPSKSTGLMFGLALMWIEATWFGLVAVVGLISLVRVG